MFEPVYRLKARIAKGTVLMRIVNLLGEEVERIEAPYDGMLIGVKTNPVTLLGDRVAHFSKVLKIVEE
jgi:predicted deacylase